MRRLFLAALVPTTALAAPFDLVHQGRLTDADGAPLDGAHDVDITLSSDAAGTVVLGTPHRFTGLDFDGGYYTLRLTGLDSAWFAGDVYVQTTIDGVDVGNPVELASSPRAVASDLTRRVETGTTRTGSCDVGEVYYDTDERRLRVCTDGDWGQDIVQDGSFRRWADGSLAENCDGYRHPVSGSYSGATGDGVYRIDPGQTGAGIDVWCEMDAHGGGWTKIINLDTSDSATRAWVDSTFWTGSAPQGGVTVSSSGDYKTAGFDRITGAELMIEVHQQGGFRGAAVYDLLAPYQTQSMHAMFNNLTNTTITDTRREVSGSVGSDGRTDNRGDSFVDHPFPVILNSTFSPVDANNTTRLGVNYASVQGDGIQYSGHMYGGMGGYHVRGGWGAHYEGASITEYCNTQGAYGTNGYAVSGTNNAFYNSGTCSGTAISVPYDYAVYLR